MVAKAQMAEEMIDEGHNADHVLDSVEFDCKAITGNINVYYKKNGRIVDKF
jgi:hypothetical protein